MINPRYRIGDMLWIKDPRIKEAEVPYTPVLQTETELELATMLVIVMDENKNAIEILNEIADAQNVVAAQAGPEDMGDVTLEARINKGVAIGKAMRFVGKYNEDL